MSTEEKATPEEIEKFVKMYRELPKEERILISNSTHTLFARMQMESQTQSTAV